MSHLNNQSLTRACWLVEKERRKKKCGKYSFDEYTRWPNEYVCPIIFWGRDEARRGASASSLTFLLGLNMQGQCCFVDGILNFGGHRAIPCSD